MVATAHRTDEKRRVIELEDPSIINGSQTQGVLKDYLAAKERSGADVPDCLVSPGDPELCGPTSLTTR